MSNYVGVSELSVAAPLFRFVRDEALPGLGIGEDTFWAGASRIIHELAPRNRELLAIRASMQAQIDDYHRARPGVPDPEHYAAFLREIGYLLPEPDNFSITTSELDSEIADQAGPQLVVPLLNARFATNAANARWGSLYDALYGTDAISEEGTLARGSTFNVVRGDEVIAYGRRFLDRYATLADGSHADVTEYQINSAGLVANFDQSRQSLLAAGDQFVGYSGELDAPTSIVLKHNGLHLELQIDRSDAIGSRDLAGIKDIVLESALTSIMDLEDSVSAVDADDKVLGYRNWLRLNQGQLTERVTKGTTTFTRTMNADRTFKGLGGEEVILHGRALMFIRHVGHLMTTDAVLDRDGNEVPEGILDALIATLGSTHDLRGSNLLRNSRASSIYVVKPKMHGPEEVAFTVELFEQVEHLFGLPRLTIKLGIMDEERRTTVNLKACVAEAKERVAFINTGFLDRTGDEIHTSLYAGAFVRKGDLKSQPFISAYEISNVDVGISAGFPRRVQIGKGMWAMPNLMAAMLEQKGAHPKSGASTAWVPSPTAATLHAMHYHETNVFTVQAQLKGRVPEGRGSLLEIPLADKPIWSKEERLRELDNNVQSILGYVVRWVDQGIGCSTVPDLQNVGLMEDRATLRISSQLLANWLVHNVISADELQRSLEQIAAVVDGQNSGDPLYEPLISSAAGPGLAFQAARDLILNGAEQPSGYVDPILHRARRLKKRASTA